MLGILHKYNVGIPHPVSQLLTKCPRNFERCLLRCIHYEGREEDAEFDSFCMKDLTMLHEELQQFIAQIGNAHLIYFMAYFSMHNSQFFVQYLKEQIALQQSTTPKECTVPSVLESLEVFTSKPAEGGTAKCLDNTRHAVQVSSLCILWIPMFILMHIDPVATASVLCRQEKSSRRTSKSHRWPPQALRGCVLISYIWCHDTHYAKVAMA